MVKCHVCQGVTERQDLSDSPTTPGQGCSRSTENTQVQRGVQWSPDSLGTGQIQGEEVKAMWKFSQVQWAYHNFREKSNASPSPMGRRCPSGRSRWDSTNPTLFLWKLNQGYTAVLLEQPLDVGILFLLKKGRSCRKRIWRKAIRKVSQDINVPCTQQRYSEPWETWSYVP